MNYEKKYNEALKWMRELYPGLHGATKEDAEHYFPELRESEDERIRKYLIDELKVAKSVGELKFTIPQPTREECIAYLEKQKEQKPIGGIYWHAIKKGERLPCRAYIWNPDYEKYPDCWEGRLIPNLENICVGADTWYLPAKDVRDLPREGVDELPEGQKNITANSSFNPDDYEIIEYGDATGIRRKDKPYEPKFKPGIKNVLNSLRPSWKPSEEQMEVFQNTMQRLLQAGGTGKWYAILESLYEQLKKL